MHDDGASGLKPVEFTIAHQRVVEFMNGPEAFAQACEFRRLAFDGGAGGAESDKETNANQGESDYGFHALCRKVGQSGAGRKGVTKDISRANPVPSPVLKDWKRKSQKKTEPE